MTNGMTYRFAETEGLRKYKHKGEYIMTKEKLMKIAERNLYKAKKSMENNYNRQGITDIERENLSNNVEFAEIVCELIKISIR